MDLDTRILNDIIILYLPNRLDFDQSVNLKTIISDVINEHPDKHIILNFKDVEYINSLVLSEIIKAMRILKEKKKKFKMCNMREKIIKIFEIVNLINQLDLYENEEEALQSFKNVAAL